MAFIRDFIKSSKKRLFCGSGGQSFEQPNVDRPTELSILIVFRIVKF